MEGSLHLSFGSEKCNTNTQTILPHFEHLQCREKPASIIDFWRFDLALEPMAAERDFLEDGPYEEGARGRHNGKLPSQCAESTIGPIV